MIERKVKTTVLEKEAGVRLDYWLAKRFTYHTRGHWQKLVKNGSVFINEGRGRPSKRLKADDLVEYRVSHIPEPEVNLHFRTVFADEELFLVNKSENLPCHPAGKFFQNTLWFRIKAELENFWIINRLDRETSGLVLIAKKLESARHLNKQFAMGQVKKKYLVLVEGSFPERLTVRGYLVNNLKSKIRKQQQVTKAKTSDGDFVSTDFYRIEEQNSLTLLQAIPKTGKYHQIRASLHSVGYPVVGDKIYGCVENAYLRFITNSLNRKDQFGLRLSRQALHAFELQFTHPKTYQVCSVQAPIPSDFQNILNTNGFVLPPSLQSSTIKTTPAHVADKVDAGDNSPVS